MARHKGPLDGWAPAAVIARFCCGFVLALLVGGLCAAVVLRLWMRLWWYVEFPGWLLVVLLVVLPVGVGILAVFRLEQVGDFFRDL
jgi:hypothetical protein